MARKSTIAHAQKILTPAQFGIYMQMPTKLSKTQLDAGERPPSEKEFVKLQADLEIAKAARKAARLEAQACEDETPKAAKAKAPKAAKAKAPKAAKAKAPKAAKAKAPKAAKAKAPKERPPQTAEKQLKIFDALEKGFALTVRREGMESLRLEVVKKTKKTATLTDGAKLHLKGECVTLSVGGKPAQFTSLRYKTQGGEAAAKPSAPAKSSAQSELDFVDAKPKVSKKQADRLAEAAYAEVCHGVQFSILDLGPMMDKVRDAIMQGVDATEAMTTYAAVYRKN